MHVTLQENVASGGDGGKRSPGRPRSERASKAILRSTLKLLQKTGFYDLSIEAIAADADVGKATVYRWWPNKAALVADAFFSSAEDELKFPDTGSVLSDMNLQMKQLVRILRGRRGRIVASLIGGGQSDPELIEEFRQRFMRPRREEAYDTLRRAIRRGELPEGLDLNLTLDALYGPIYLRFLIRHDHLTNEFVDQLCSLVIEGAGKLK
jgi:AcrR family transcriptional regulator